jgi:hypothetical protein
MTTKEKADELLRKFFSVGFEDGEAKVLANIVCDEILEVIGYPTYFHETRIFWQQVKEELNANS